MQSENRVKIWFPEPEVDDLTHGKRGEHTLDYLARSTVKRAIKYRKALNHNLGKMPQKFQERFMHSARNHWVNVEFELIVGRFLQTLDADLAVEKEISSGKRPDFLASFRDGKVFVEATVPVFDLEIIKKLKERNSLLAIIESQIPSGWNVGVNVLPDIGLSESKNEFKHVVNEIMSEIELSKSKEPKTVNRELGSGEIELRFIRCKPGVERLIWESYYLAWNRSKYRIHRAAKRKKKQVKGAVHPVILAIHGSGLSCEWENFDQAIFGQTIEVFNFNTSFFEPVFCENGLFLQNRESPPNRAGVLAFIRVDVLAGGDPVFYRNPFYEESLPSAIRSLEQRCFNAQTKQISTRKSMRTNIMECIRDDALG